MASPTHSTNAPYHKSNAANTAPNTPLAPSILLRSAVWKAKLPALEKLLLLAMLRHRGDGTFVWASLQRVADFCGLSRKTVQRMINGEPARKTRSGKLRAARLGLRTRRVLVEIAPAHRGRRIPTTYRIQLEAAPEDTRVIDWIEGKNRTQLSLSFDEDQQRAQTWIAHNPGCWQAIIQDLRNVAESLIGTDHDEQERLEIFHRIATQRGMPDQHARRVFAAREQYHR